MNNRHVTSDQAEPPSSDVPALERLMQFNLALLSRPGSTS
jgi:hypothetical protein